MKRRALIIYCNDTSSGPLKGPKEDRNNYLKFLTSPLGGHWTRKEIFILHNPTIAQVKIAVINHLNGADYSFTIFTGHGEMRPGIASNIQYLELWDGDLSVLQLRNNAPKQTIIVDACRGIRKETDVEFLGLLEHLEESGFAGPESTRQLFDEEIDDCEDGLIVLYAASENQTALDTQNGGAYLLSLLVTAEEWALDNNHNNILPIDVAHEWASNFLNENFDTIQVPEIRGQKRRNFFPFAVKL